MENVLDQWQKIAYERHALTKGNMEAAQRGFIEDRPAFVEKKDNFGTGIRFLQNGYPRIL
ncbi:MAG: hypothetical protein R2794_03180 [Chitinophagales bacterium]